jgi:N-methylhydantoinase B
MLDPIKFEVIRNALLEATEEMAVALKRSAYSVNIKTRTDFSCAFFDHELRTVAQATGQPVHLGSLAHFVPRVITTYDADNLHAGDMLVANDPYLGGVHLNDVTLIAPVILPSPCRRGAGGEVELLGYVAALAHHVDVGGGAPGSIGAFREVFQEGIIIPPVKLVRAGQLDDDVFRLMLAQIRSKRETAGDFRAQIAACHTGARRLNQLIAREGLDNFHDYVDELLRYTERRTRAELAQLPKGVFSAEGVVDNDGYTDQPVRLSVKITIDDEGVFFDFDSCDAQRRAPVNSTYAMTFAGCAYALKCLIDSDVPVNDGFYRNVRMNAPLGTVVNCSPPAPVVGGWETQTRLCDVIFKAFAQALPERVPAGTKAMMAQIAFGGMDPRDGDYYAYYEAIAGGYGGRATKDGADAVQAHGQNTENAPIEQSENNYPFRITRYELIEDSDGAGKRRGGLGLRRDYHFPDHEVSLSILSDRDRWGPHGLFGGMAGQTASYILNPDDGVGAIHESPLRLSSKTTVQLKVGDTLSFRTCGGGGYGDPRERDPQFVLRDVREGKVSVERAREQYGLAVETTWWTTVREPFQFLKVGRLVDGDLELVLAEQKPAIPEKAYVPAYVFQMKCVGCDGPIGRIALRIGNPPLLARVGGHVGYSVEPAHRGHHYAARSVRLLMPLARRHGMTSLWITCNPDNIASRRTCELAGAEFVEIVDVPTDHEMYARGEREKCRYRLGL